MKLPVIGAVLKPLRGEVSLHMQAPAEKVWALVSDVTRIGSSRRRRSRRGGAEARPARRSVRTSRDT